jgi:hypothetical protein
MSGFERGGDAPPVVNASTPDPIAPKHAVQPRQWLTLVDRASERMQAAWRDTSMNHELVALETDIRGIGDSLRRRATAATMGLIRE